MTTDAEYAEQSRKLQRERKPLIIRALAEYLVRDQARKSIELEMGKPYAKEWSVLRGTTSVRGYPTVEEAIKALEHDFA